MYLIDRERQILSVVIAIRQHFDVIRNELRLLSKLLFEEMDCFVNRSVEEPANDAQCKHIAGLEDRLIIESAIFECFFGEGSECNRHNLNRFRKIEFSKRIVGCI